jgi:hypothetical protein
MFAESAILAGKRFKDAGAVAVTNDPSAEELTLIRFSDILKSQVLIIGLLARIIKPSFVFFIFQSESLVVAPSRIV